MKKIMSLITFFFSSLQISIYAQSVVNLSGSIFDKETEASISLVNIYTKDKKIGTISTNDGDFSIKIPANKKDGYLYFSSIGYQTDSLLISTASNPLLIKLIPITYSLKEVYVMPDSTLITLLRKAYNKIQENYPNYPTRQEGFYQETLLDNNGNLTELIEAVLSVYKESYEKKINPPGQIEILKSRNRKFLDLGVYSYQGAFNPIESDFVLQRKNYINPDKVKNYLYTFNGIKSNKERDCYEIEFCSAKKNDNSINGVILIDVESLAYVSFEIHNGQNEENKLLSTFGIPCIESNEHAVYEQQNGKWYLKQANFKGLYSYRDKTFSGSNSFVSTNILVDSVKPIPIEKRLNYRDPILSKTESYTPEGWTDSEILVNEDMNQLNLQFFPIETSSFFQEPISKKRSAVDVLSKIISKTTVGWGISYNHATFESMNNEISFQPNENLTPFHISNNKPSTTSELVLANYNLGYKTNEKWRFYGQVSYDFFNKDVSSKEIGLGIEFKKNLNEAGYPLFLGTSISIFDKSYYRSLGSFKNNTSFSYNGKMFDANELTFGYGNRRKTISPRLSLSKRMSKFITMEIYVNYHITIHSEYGIRIKENDGFFLSRKKSLIEINDSHLTIDNIDALKSGISIQNLQTGIIFYLF